MVEQNLERAASDLGISPEQIAQTPKAVNKNTKAYIGLLVDTDNSGVRPVLGRIGHLDHIYTSYPDGIVTVLDLEIGGHPKEALIVHLRRTGQITFRLAHTLRENGFFATKSKTEPVRILKVSIGQMGLSGDDNDFWKVVRRIQDLGGSLAPAEVGLYLRMKDIEQPVHNHYVLAMEPLPLFSGQPSIFELRYQGRDRERTRCEERILDIPITNVYNIFWGSRSKFAFAVPKQK